MNLEQLLKSNEGNFLSKTLIAEILNLVNEVTTATYIKPIMVSEQVDST